MLEFIVNNIEFFVFVFLMTLFLFWKRKNVEVQGSFPILYVLMYKTKLGLDKMDKWSKNHPKVFLYLAYLSWFVGVVGMVLAFIFMFWQLGFIAEHQLEQGGGLVLPLKTESGMDSTVPVFYVPFWYWLIALFILVVVHEFAHGVIAERFNIRIKSSGFAFMGILAPFMPAAFVEPDEKQLKKKAPWKQIAVFGAGSTSNFIFGGLFLLLLIFVASPFVAHTMTYDKISFYNITEQSGLQEYNLSSGEIVSLNGISQKDELLTSLMSLEPNQTLKLEIKTPDNLTNSYEIVTYAHEINEDKGMVGISLNPFTYENKNGFAWLGTLPIHIETLLFYIVLLNIGIGLMNLLPLWITDGGQITKLMLTTHFKKRKKLANSLYHILSWITLITIIMTMWPGVLYSFLALF